VYASDGIVNSPYSNTVEVLTPDVPPLAPSDLTATVISATQIDLAWTDNALTEDGFIIERSDNGGPWTQVAQVGVGTIAFSDLTVSPATDYQYQVFAFNNITGNSTPAISALVTTPDVPPAAPTGLMTTAVTSTQVDLAWMDNSNNETGFVVQRSEDGGMTWASFSPTAVNATTFSDTTVAPNVSYLYQVYATNGVGDSAVSGPITVNVPSGTPPTAPTNPLVIGRTQSSLTLSWTDNSNAEAGFAVQIAIDKNFTQSLQTFIVDPNVTEYQFYPLAPNTKYYMRVAAFNGAGYSTWTVTITDKTLK